MGKLLSSIWDFIFYSTMIVLLVIWLFLLGIFVLVWEALKWIYQMCFKRNMSELIEYLAVFIFIHLCIWILLYFEIIHYSNYKEYLYSILGYFMFFKIIEIRNIVRKRQNLTVVKMNKR